MGSLEAYFFCKRVGIVAAWPCAAEWLSAAVFHFIRRSCIVAVWFSTAAWPCPAEPFFVSEWSRSLATRWSCSAGFVDCLFE